MGIFNLLKRDDTKSIKDFEDWKQLQYNNEVAVEAYEEQQMILQEYKDSVPIYNSKLWG